tara:strand:+ start:494 stop:715 length:222 start_codon:yes stop_codon:yes gene_type:complete
MRGRILANGRIKKIRYIHIPPVGSSILNYNNYTAYFFLLFINMVAPATTVAIIIPYTRYPPSDDEHLHEKTGR